MVARFGDRETRGHFLRQYEDVLGGIVPWIQGLSEDEQQMVFQDAVRMREGGLPRSRAALKLALPRWFVRRIAGPLEVWEEAADYRPGGVAIDPICHMCVDQKRTPSRLVEGGQEFYFCCPHCLALYGDMLLRTA